jgi:peptidoglycan/LPS O-acetylase OafA/YrhL
MNNIDIINIGFIIISTIIYIILSFSTKYKSVKDHKLTDAEYRMIYFTTVYGFIYGIVLVYFQQKYEQNIKSIWLWIIILFICILLIFSAFYSQVYTDEDPNTLLGKFSYAMVPILPSFVMLSESSISRILDHDNDYIFTETSPDSGKKSTSEDSFDELLGSD